MNYKLGGSQFKLASLLAKRHVAAQEKSAAALGKVIAQPLKRWLEQMYAHINLVKSFDEFYLWVQDFRKVREIQRRSGVPYDIGEHWRSALEEADFTQFSAADQEILDWSAVFLDPGKNPNDLRKFWQWVANPFEVRLWLGDIFRKFWYNIWQEHLQMLEDQFNPEEPDLPEEGESEPATEKEEAPRTWDDDEAAAEAKSREQVPQQQ